MQHISFKRMMAWLLVMVMIIGLIPANVLTAFAAESYGDVLDTAIIMSDLHIGTAYNGTTPTDSASKQTLLQNVLTQIKEDKDPVSTVTSAGDMYSSNSNTITGNASTITGWVQGVFTDMDTSSINYVWTDHDRNATDIDMESQLVYGAGSDGQYGTEDDANYYIYLLSMADLATFERYVSFYTDEEVTAHVAEFEEAVSILKTDRPLFIVGHQPLFNRRGDNAHALEWVTAINKVAQNMDVAYFFGHNHKYDIASDYYYAKGSVMSVPTSEGDGYSPAPTATDVTLNFTHICAGYLDPATTSSTTRTGTALAVTIYTNGIEFATYDSNGVHSGTYAVNTTIYRDHESGESSGSDTVPEVPSTTPTGTIGKYTGVAQGEVDDSVTTDSNGWVAIVDPVPGVTGTHDLTPYGNSWTTLSTPGYIYTQVTSITANGEYVIVGAEDDVALYGTTSLGSYSDITIDGTTLTSGVELTLWTFESSSSGTIDNGTRYLRYSNNKFSLSTFSTDFTITTSGSNFSIRSGNYSFYYDGEAWTRSGNRTAEYVRLYQYTGPSTGLYAYLKGNLTYTITAGMDEDAVKAMVKNGIDIQYATKADYSDEENYPDDGTGMTWTLDPSYDPDVPGDYAVTIAYNGTTIGVAEVIVPDTAGTNGTFYKLSGNLTHNVEVGTDADTALAGLRNQLTVQSFQGMSAEPTTSTVYENIDVSKLTLTWVGAYDANTPGDYEVEVSYNGEVLGTAEVVVPNTYKYYIAEGETLYTVDEGTSADDALAAVMAGLTVSVADDRLGTNKTVIYNSTTANENITFQWVDTYNSSYRGPYTVEVFYDGTSLGTVEVEVEVNAAKDPTDTEMEGNVTITETVTSGGGYVYVRVDSFVDGEEYLLIGEDGPTNGNPIALVNNNGSDTYVGVTVNTSAIEINGTTYTNGYIELDNANAVFTASGSASSGFTLKNGSYYIGGSSATTLSSSAATVTYDATAVRLKTTGSTPNYLYYSTYSGETWKWSTSSSSSTSSRNMWIYQKMELPGGGTSDVEKTYSVDASDVVHNLVEDGANTKQIDFSLMVDGAELTTLPAGGSWSFTVFSDTSGIINSISEDGLITFNNGSGRCLVKVAYTWTDDNGTHTAYKYINVTAKAPTNYPEYPDEGAVKVNKTATGIDFQSTGIAQIELSASGVPLKKGADVIIMLDTSSSMNSNYVKDADGNNTTKTRLQVLEESLASLITQLQADGPDGQPMDIRVAIADFNGYFNDDSSPYDYDDSTDAVRNDSNGTGSGYSQTQNAQVYTNTTGALDETAFVDASKLEASYDLGYTSGTNYDYAFDAIYQLGTAIKAQNAENGETRDLFVIFMTDGAGFQWNYFRAQNGYSKWNSWITGAWTEDDLTTSNINSTTHSYYYDLEDHNGDGMRNEHRMANAVKGDPSSYYEIIRKNTNGLPYGTLTAVEGKENMYMAPGLGATMFSINFDAQTDGVITADYIDKVVASLASSQTGSTQYYYKIKTADDLSGAFKSIGDEIAYAASNARFVDKIGNSFNLQMEPFTRADGTTVNTTVEIFSYDIYTKDDVDTEVNGVTVTEDMIGDRKGTKTLLEVIMFDANGKAYSNLIDSDSDGKYGVTVNADGTYTLNDNGDNILAPKEETETDGLVDGVIYAKTFLYNTNPLGVAVDGVNIPTGKDEHGLATGSTNVLPSETFYWKLGTIQTSELAMRYYVYLAGSMEGTKEGGSYKTNEFAILYYDNYLGNPCLKETSSPVMAWKEAIVSYAFYLVDEEGNIVVNQTSGATGTFANKVAVTNPVVYKSVLLNADGTAVESINIASLGVLPEGYELYDISTDGKTGATYTVQVTSNSAGFWKITSVKDKATTYVTQFDPDNAAAYSNTKEVAADGVDYSHTVVWFAVVWKRQALPDSVVVDYGLPVDIHVLGNDMFGENGKLHAIGPYSNSLNLDGHDTVLNDSFYQKDEDGNATSTVATTYNGTYGIATINVAAGTVRYQLSSMVMNGYEKFAYAVNYTGSENAGYYYDTVTVIPATTIYYEDNFLEYYVDVWSESENKWVTYTGEDFAWVQDANDDKAQDEDRPGKYSLTDANNIYGFDHVNEGISTFSLNGFAKVTVDYDHSAVAEFTFAGTGFDIISMTDCTTGTILVDVIDINNKSVKQLIVDTFYSYKKVAGDANNDGKTEEGEFTWVISETDSDSIYQVPVIKVEGLSYGTYTVKIRAQWDPVFENVEGSTSYDFYLDAIRIYDPANDGAADGSDDTTIEDAYKADGEGWPSYIELRNALIDAETLGNADTSTVLTGLVFIDGDAEVGDAQLSDYKNYGPNNEVYLAPGQRVAFILNTPANIDQVHIGFKSADGNPVTYTVTNVAKATNSETGVTAGDYYGAKTSTLNTATDMYYDITGYKGDIIVISNTGDRYNTKGILSITNIKSTYTSDPNGDETSGASGTLSAQTYSVMTLSAAAEEPVAESNETTIYMTPAAATLALRAVNTMYLPETFEPEQLEISVNRDHLKEGDKVKVTVKTSDDVAYITVNGETVTKYRTNRRTGERTWTVTLKAEEVGELNIEVIAYDAEDLASDPVTETVTVEAKKDPKERAREIMKDLFGRIFG